ncbi:MAG: 3'-5' exonuclease [Chlamydiia bacterium]|nr:3'-5' exonuclease [Chlamydiia bacterium]
MKGIFLDLETSGLDSRRHRVLEIAFKIIDLATGEELAAYHSVVKQGEAAWKGRDRESIRINGMSWDRVQTGKPEEEVCRDVIAVMQEQDIQRGKAVFICQNPSFDRAFFAQIVDTYEQERLLWPYHWLDFASMYWVLRIDEARSGQNSFPKHLQLSKDAIAQHYKLPPEQRPHQAMNGVDHLILCYKATVGLVPVTNSC